MTETAGQIDIFDVLADVAADEQNLHVDRHGIPVLIASPTRGVEARIAEFETWLSTMVVSARNVVHNRSGTARAEMSEPLGPSTHVDHRGVRDDRLLQSRSGSERYQRP